MDDSLASRQLMMIYLKLEWEAKYRRTITVKINLLPLHTTYYHIQHSINMLIFPLTGGLCVRIHKHFVAFPNKK